MRTDTFYDLHVPGEEHYLADGIWSHNSGKTRLVAEIAAELGISVAYGTPTHKAAAVLRGKLGDGQRERVRTYHSLLYYTQHTYTCASCRRRLREKDCGCGAGRRGEDECGCPRAFHGCCASQKVTDELTFTIREHVGGHRRLLVLDEASMLPQQTVEEIRSLGVPVLLVGDHGQLSPVKAGMNAWMLCPDEILTSNHRQSEANGIIEAAYRVRTCGDLPPGLYGDGSTAVVRVKDNPGALACMDPGRLPPGPSRVIIAATNALRAQVNKQIHGSSPAPRTGDRVISLRNNYRGLERWGIAQGYGGWGPLPGREPEMIWNGQTGTVAAVNPSGYAMPQTSELVIELDPLPGATEPVYVHEPAAANVQFGAEYKLRPDQYPRHSALWDYAYAVTCHKAQGSEFEDVVVLDTGAPEWTRWMYTGCTRAKDRLIVLSWK